MKQAELLRKSIHKIKSFLEDEIPSQINRTLIDKQKAEIVLLIYQRPQNLRNILKGFLNQTYKHFSINILNNNIKQKSYIDTVVKGFPELDIKLEHSEENLGCNYRFDFARKTQGDPILFFDDDMIPYNDFVAYSIDMYNIHGHNTVLGWHAFQFTSEDYVFGRRELDIGEVADSIGTGSSIMSRALLHSLKELQVDQMPEYIQCEKAMDDLWLSYVLRTKKYNIFKIEKKVNHIDDGHDTYKTIKESKGKIFLKLRKKGWPLIKDKEPQKFHILVTTYNSQDYITRCIESIQSQDHTNFSCIIIDDGSTDKTLRKVKSLVKGDSRFRLYRNKKNYGAAYSRHKGFGYFDARDDDICMYIDGDDFLLTKYALNRIAQEYQDEKCWMTYGSLEGPFSDQSGPIPSEVSSSKDFRKTPWVYHSPRTYKYFLLNKLTKEDFVGKKHEYLPTATDMKFTYHLLELCGPHRIRYIPEKIYFYREHKKNSWKTYPNKEAYKEYIQSLQPFTEIQTIPL